MATIQDHNDNYRVATFNIRYGFFRFAVKVFVSAEH
jgi:hypothetical protein